MQGRVLGGGYLGAWEEKTAVLREEIQNPEEIQNQEGRAGLSTGHGVRTRARKPAMPPAE